MLNAAVVVAIKTLVYVCNRSDFVSICNKFGRCYNYDFRGLVIYVKILTIINFYSKRQRHMRTLWI